MPKYLNNIADMQQEAEEKRAAMRREREEQQAAQEQQAAPPTTAPATVYEASASGNSTKSKDKRTKLTDQGITQLVITESFKKHTMTVYEPLYQLMTTMASAWNVNIQDVVAVVMMEGVRDLKGKDRKHIDKLIKRFVTADTDNEISEMRKSLLLAQAGLTPADLK